MAPTPADDRALRAVRIDHATRRGASRRRRDDARRPGIRHASRPIRIAGPRIVWRRDGVLASPSRSRRAAMTPFRPDAECPLDGLRVLDLSRLVAGNMVSLQLAD